jgi:predicted transcriptional regulator
MNFQDDLRKLMDKNDLSSKEFCRLINCSSAYFSRILNGHKTPSPTMRRRIKVIISQMTDNADKN